SLRKAKARDQLEKPLSFRDKGEGSILTPCEKARGSLEAASLSSGKGKTVYISRPPYLVEDVIAHRCN
nr:hypothetical protein [Tanacetum cinerariifolium]